MNTRQDTARPTIGTRLIAVLRKWAKVSFISSSLVAPIAMYIFYSFGHAEWVKLGLLSGLATMSMALGFSIVSAFVAIAEEDDATIVKLKDAVQTSDDRCNAITVRALDTQHFYPVEDAMTDTPYRVGPVPEYYFVVFQDGLSGGHISPVGLPGRNGPRLNLRIASGLNLCVSRLLKGGKILWSFSLKEPECDLNVHNLFRDKVVIAFPGYIVVACRSVDIAYEQLVREKVDHDAYFADLKKRVSAASVSDGDGGIINRYVDPIHGQSDA